VDLHTLSALPPNTDGVMVLSQCKFIQRLVEHIHWLIKCVNGMQRDLPTFNIVPEEVVLDVDVPSAGPHLKNFGNLKCAAFVLKDSAIYHWLS